jgi:lipopolysaccharide biosynthesis regulator YciM
MSDPPRSTSHPTSFPPGPSATSPAAVYLRAEQATATDPQHKALLLHELGVVEERASDEMGAAREFLAAFNSYPQFREPLEGLVRLLERRKSVKNLPKLLDALLRAAESPQERGRALLKRAAFAVDYRKDDGAGRSALLQATSERPADTTAWLELEVLAGRTSDVALRLSALEARAKNEQNPTWRALILMSLAELHAEQGDGERATQLLGAAMEQEGGARFLAAQALERHATRAGDRAALADALETQAELVITALADSAQAESLGVPRFARQAEVAADAWLRAADARKQLGDAGRAAALLDRAIERVGSKTPLLAARLAVAETSGDTATAERIAETLLDQGMSGAGAASLYMRVAEAAANRDDADGALTALGKGLQADPGCIPARALQIDLLGNATDAGALAHALEAMAGELPNDEAKGRAFLLSAYVFAVQARDLAGAKAALSQAGMCGVPPGILARTARMLASILEDAAWYEDATRRLISSGAQDGEAVSLWFELGRNRLLRGDDEGAGKAFTAIAQAPGGTWLGPALGAYALGQAENGTNGASEANEGEVAERPSLVRDFPGSSPSRPPPSPATLDQLRAVEGDPTTGRALALAAARRADLAGNAEDARQRLHDLFEADRSDVIAAIYLADLEKRAGRPLAAAKVLATLASSVSSTALATSLHIEAAVLRWRARERRQALDELEEALSPDAPAVSSLFGWALRGMDAGSPDDRARLVQRAAELSDDKQLLSLQHLCLQLFASLPDVDTARSLFDGIEVGPAAPLATAASLARILWDEKGGDRSALLGAVNRVAQADRKAAPIAAWENLRLARQEGERLPASEYARNLADSLRSLPADLEWLGTAMGADDRMGEVDARRTIASALGGDARAAVASSAALIALLDAPATLQPLLGAADASSRLMNLELATAGSSPKRRAKVLEDVGDALGDEARLDGLVMAGYNYLALGASEDAMACFETATKARPDDLFAWEGLRSAAEALGDVEQQATACTELGELCNDDKKGALYWEKAALFALDALEDEARGELALERAFARDPERKVAFDRLFRRVRQRAESDKLLSLITRRLEVAGEPDEIAKLFWERARVLRQKGDREGAVAALENVTMIEPDHVGALALRGEIEITQSNFVAAADCLSRLALLDSAPSQQRLMSGVAAVDLYENKLDDTPKALEVLIALHTSGLSTLPVRERMARAAAKAGSWEHATTILEELMKERSTKEGRIEAARLSMAIWRDKKKEPAHADKAVTKLLEESPEDSEALDLVIDTNFPAPLKKKLLADGRTALVEALGREPIDRERVARLTKMAKILADWPLRQATLGVLASLSGADAMIEQELGILDARVARLPQVAVDEVTVGLIGDPEDRGAIPQLFAALAEALSEALGPSLEGLGVTKKQRVDPRSGLPLRNEIAAWAGALGLGDFDVYIGGKEPNGVQGVAGEVPSLVVGTGVRAPLTPEGRQAIVRELFALRRGISVTRTRDDTTVAAIVVAACNLAEVRIDAPPYAMLSDVQRQLGKALSRRTRKVLPDLCRAVVNERSDARAWARAALASMYRMAAIAAGDVSLVLTDVLGAPLSKVPAMVSHDERARRLIAFVLSPRYLELRGKLGMGVT